MILPIRNWAINSGVLPGKKNIIRKMRVTIGTIACVTSRTIPIKSLIMVCNVFGY